MKKININIICNILKLQTHKKIEIQDPLKILLTTILSARTKDKITAKAAKELFTKIQSIEDLKNIEEEELQHLIYPVGFYKTKAKHLKQLPKVLKENFNNKIPETVEQLTELPGVGRKTANLVVAIGFKKPAICVDTHVYKITNRLGYIKTKTPFETEIALRKKLPKKYWIEFNTILVPFGQKICKSINPRCNKCPIEKHCNKIILISNSSN